MYNLSTCIKYLNPVSQKVGYLGWIGFQNLGDEALFDAISKLMKPVEALQILNYYKKGKFIEKLAEKFCYEGVMLGGGTLINSVSYLKKLSYFQKKGFKTFVFGAGVLDPKFYSNFDEYPNVMENWVDCLRACDFVSVRGPLSKKILSEYGFQDAKICGDPVFFFAEEKLTIKNRGKTIGINVGTTLHGKCLYGNSDEDVILFIKKLVKVLVKLGYRIKLFPVFQGDIQAAKDVLHDSPENTTIVADYLDLKSYMQSLDDVDFFIGEKLHSVIIALCKHIPSIMLAYRPKCLDLMSSLELDEFVVKTDELEVDSVISLLQRLENWYIDYQSHLFGMITGYKHELVASADKIKAGMQQA